MAHRHSHSYSFNCSRQNNTKAHICKLYRLTFIQSLHIWSYQLLFKHKGPEMDGKDNHNYIPDHCHKPLHIRNGILVSGIYASALQVIKFG